MFFYKKFITIIAHVTANNIVVIKLAKTRNDRNPKAARPANGS